ncbi:efflux RND transporter periplasmic adaptor subunit [Aquisalinus flavus]|uniref:RND transporter n=1 Tax=Aquisalinus flavus TaxID=1526572 RepID=A0A8J2V445_9PROT|nr:efflux RND transporter periplasmic adaptor subunit [Aquisalinus flavus]MBD0427256.1 efflux RND transporter periplasmic adaptor subunit [Aquisalinus flavus]UNE47070.1 efflux RND transporter periplasmic adaptor subunit [Aquisalinus flavus]GGC99550.1 RND transporter [Aquisalinus flavus]
MAGWRSLPSSVKTALLITAGVVAYFALSMLLRSGGEEIVADEETRLFRVVTETVDSQTITEKIEMRGRTEARRLVVVRAETPGQVRATPSPEGQFVERGRVLCEIDVETRSATLGEARAAFEKARIDYEAAQELADKGFASEAGVASARAVYDQAEAALQRASTDLGKTSVRAPFAGILEEQQAEAGDFLNVGAPCATLAELDPIRIRGAVPERDVARIRENNMAQVVLATGEEFPARVTYVAAAASDATRTYAVELEAENPGTIRAGQTATVLIDTGDTDAWLLPHDVVVTSDQGQSGVRTVIRTGAKTGEVVFRPVSITGDSADGYFVSGLSGEQEIIVRGQNYVRDGQAIEIAAPGETYQQSDRSDSQPG